MNSDARIAHLEHELAELKQQLGVAEPSSPPPAGQMIELTEADLYEFEAEPLFKLAEWLRVDNANVPLIVAAQLRDGASVQHEVNRLVREGFKLADAELVVGEVQAMISHRIPPGRMTASDELAALRRVVASNLRNGQGLELAIGAVTKQLRNREFATWVVCGVRDELARTPARLLPHVAEPGLPSRRPEPKPQRSGNGELIPREAHVFRDPADEAQGPLPADPIFSRTSA